VGRAGQGDLFYNARIQMSDIGADKYLLFQHTGGDFAVRLYRRPPWYWPVVRTVTDAFDHVRAIHHAQGSQGLGWVASALLLVVVAWVYLRNKPRLSRSLPAAIGAGLLLTALRSGHALGRQAYLTALYAQWLRTMDEGFEISVSFTITSFLMASGGTWLYLNARSRWARKGAFMAILFPTCLMAAFWLGSVAVIDLLARREYGFPLYGYGGGLMPLIVCVVESVPIALVLWGLQRIVRADAFGRDRGWMIAGKRQPSRKRPSMRSGLRTG
jgi:hypothetical protein